MSHNEEFLILKVLDDNLSIINRLEESKNKYEERIYNIVSDLDQEIIKHFEEHVGINIVFILFEKRIDEYSPYRIFVGSGHFFINPRDNKKRNIKYKITHIIDSKLIIDNFVLSSGIDLKSDFVDKNYIITETSIKLYKKLLDSVQSYSADTLYNSIRMYEDHSDDPTGKLSQKNSHCIRAFYLKEGNPYEKRPEFQRDRERILHSKSFRRLVDKAQIFTSSKGDHFRTRMTHTLEVVNSVSIFPKISVQKLPFSTENHA